MTDLRVVLVAENANPDGAGEVARPYHYFRTLRERGVDAHLVVHERSRKWLAERPGELEAIHFVREAVVQRALWWLGRPFSERLNMISFGAVSAMITQGRQKRLLKEIVARREGCVVHQAAPIAVKIPSRIHGLGVPVVIGPMNGHMDYPPAFRRRDNWLSRLLMETFRVFSGPLQRIFPGKLRADALLVSNERSKLALPRGVAGQVIELVANAVDTEFWSPSAGETPRCPRRFVYWGRFVRFKALDLLLRALVEVKKELPVALDFVGDGPERRSLQSLTRSLGLQDVVVFKGWLKGKALVDAAREGDVFVFPSLREAGGAAVVEAMSAGLPVIAADWAGPAQYLTEECGILVPVDSQAAFTRGLAAAMSKLGGSDELCRAMGEAARRRAVAEFDWNRRVDRLLEVYESVLRARADGSRAP